MKKRKKVSETAEFLLDFTQREDKLLARARELNISLPNRLKEWRHWIGDSQIYLNELKNFVDKYDTTKPN